MVGGPRRLARALSWFTVPGLLVAVLLAFLLPPAEPRPAVERRVGSGWGEALGSSPTWLAFTAYLCFNIAFWGFIGWMPSYLNATRHIALAQLGAVAALPYVCGFFGTILCGWLGSTLLSRQRAALVATAYVLAGAALFVAFSAQSVAQSIAGLSFAAFFLYGGFGPFWTVAIDLIAPDMRGSVTGFVNFGGQIGGFFAPIVVGAIVGATKSFSGGFIFMIGALLLSAASLLWLQTTSNRGARRGLHEEPRLRPA
jgi:sugar phosphate permease